jgi:hypothetical protein
MNRLRRSWNQQIDCGYTLAQNDSRAARRNILHAICLILLFNIFVSLALVTLSLWPLLFGILLLATFVQRSALQAKHSTHIPTRLLHGLQTQFNQIPLFIGQLNYRTRRKK